MGNYCICICKSEQVGCLHHVNEATGMNDTVNGI